MGLKLAKKNRKPKVTKIIPIKIVLLGDAEVGKTAICNIFFGMDYPDLYLASIGHDKIEKRYELNDGEITKLIIWDTPGQERFHSSSLKAINPRVGGCVLVFDVTNRKSFDNLERWLTEIKEKNENIIIFLFGNKIDIDKEKWAVKEEEIEEFAKRKGLQYYGVSAKHNMNINYGFDDLANKIHDKLKQK